MTNMVPELDIYVASLINVRPDEDLEAFEEERETVSQVQDQLRELGIEVDLLAQPGAELWESNIESLDALYQLSRIAVYLEQGKDITPVLEEGPVIYDELDSAVTAIWTEQATTRFPHLINLQGTQSYFLPVDFEQPVWLPFENEAGEPDSVFFGSAVRLQRELTDLGEQMRAADVPAGASAFRCLRVLRDATTQSISFDLPVIVW